MGWRERKRGNLVEIVVERRRFKVWYDSDEKIFTYSRGREEGGNCKPWSWNRGQAIREKGGEGAGGGIKKLFYY